MTIRSITYLKAKFETNDVPTQTDYQDVFDSFLSLDTSATQVIKGRIEAVSISAQIVSAFYVYSVKNVLSYKTNVSAAGGTQAAATRLNSDVSYVLGNDVLGCGVVMATCEPGRVQYITNTNTTALSVFPASGGNFIGTAENAPISLSKNGTMIVTHHTTSAYGVVRMQGV